MKSIDLFRYPLRRVIWGSFVICGHHTGLLNISDKFSYLNWANQESRAKSLIYTTYNIVQNTKKYLSYPTKFEIDVESAQMQFPKITICLNSMHSKPGLEKSTSKANFLNK